MQEANAPSQLRPALAETVLPVSLPAKSGS
jgi:hypothetical protein